MKQAPPGRLSVSLWGDRMDRGKSVELWFVQVQEVHQYQEVHVRADEQPWSSQNYGCGTGQMMRRLMASLNIFEGLGHGFFETLVMLLILQPHGCPSVAPWAHLDHTGSCLAITHGGRPVPRLNGLVNSACSSGD